MLQSVSIRDGAFRAETAREKRRLAYDLADALNQATKAMQAEWRRDIRKNAKVRRESFTMRQVKITQFASVRRGVVSSVLAIDPRPRSILANLQDGGDRPNLTKGGKPMAIPMEGTLARPDAGSPATLISRLKLQHDKGGTWKGGRRAFLIPGVGVFQRTGKGEGRKRMAGGKQKGDDLKLLWTLETRARLAKRFHFYEISAREFPSLFARSLSLVLDRKK